MEDGPLVVAHGLSGDGQEGEVFFAVFRFENGLLTEQWRFAVPAPNGQPIEREPIEAGQAQCGLVWLVLFRQSVLARCRCVLYRPDPFSIVEDRLIPFGTVSLRSRAFASSAWLPS